jgi:hypothetical protein
VVWNEVQRREAITLHDVPSDRVAITGAQSFDEWFARRPRERSDFFARVGLDASRPYILYVGGALFPAELTEAEWVLRRWIPELRRDPRLRDTGILVRPHPRRLEQWARVSFDGIENAVAWPSRDAPMPVDEDSRADFFDSLYHSAVVVGINTTAMIEAAVVGRAVHTILAPEFAESQVGTRHFAYLREVAGGVVRTAHSFDEHRDQLALALAGGDAEGERRRVEFLRAFVRPHGLERPALPYLVAEIEGVAALGPAPKAHTSPALLPVRAALRVTMAASRAVRLLRHR